MIQFRYIDGSINSINIRIRSEAVFEVAHLPRDQVEVTESVSKGSHGLLA